VICSCIVSSTDKVERNFSEKFSWSTLSPRATQISLKKEGVIILQMMVVSNIKEFTQFNNSKGIGFSHGM
jgi:hypothetical protein